jgi:hypothetical protein
MIAIEKEHLEMIRAITWSLYRTTGFDQQELFSQGCLIYCEAYMDYDPKKKAKLSTYVYRRVLNELIHYIRFETEWKLCGLDVLKDLGSTPVYEYFNNFDSDVKVVMRTALDCAEDYEEKIILWAVREALRHKGWGWARIWKGIQETKATLNQTELHRIIL